MSGGRWRDPPPDAEPEISRDNRMAEEMGDQLASGEKTSAGKLSRQEGGRGHPPFCRHSKTKRMKG